VFGLVNFTLIIPMLNLLFDESTEGTLVNAATQPTFELSIDYLVATFDYYFKSEIAQNGRMGALKFVCAILVFSVFTSNIFRYLSVATIEKVRAHLVLKLRQAVFDKTISLHLGYFSANRKGDLISRITTDVQEVENSVASTLTVVFKEPITIIGYFIVMLKISPNLTLFTLLVIPLSGLIISSITKKLKKASFDGQESIGRMLSILDESLGGIRIIKAFNATDYIRDKFFNENSRYAQLARSIALRREKAPPFSEFMGVLVVVLILYYGGKLIIDKESDLTASAFMTFVALFSQILRPAKAISTSLSNIQRGLASGERIFQLIDEEPAIVDKPDAKSIQVFEHSIRFEHVSFAYGEHTVLKDIHFEVKKGQTVALVGPSGGGKSTIADLIPRFYDPQKGAITIDGTDIRNLSIASVRQLMGIVTQESILFNDSIYNNIAFCKPNATKEEVEQAARIANAHEFILKSENGYDTIIGDRGVKLSGGQRQRISIARAVLKNPEILILDEATSALDTESEKLVQEALNNLLKNRTAIVIAHRLSTVQNADKIIVVHQGSIAEEGTHASLMAKTDGLYKKLIELQSLQ
jgi:subfamily B ATP-binding cassette protein MsbA